MANISITNPVITNSETSDVTKLTANDNDLLNGLTDGSKDININKATANTVDSVTTQANSILEHTASSGVTIDSLLIKDGKASLPYYEAFLGSDVTTTGADRAQSSAVSITLGATAGGKYLINWNAYCTTDNGAFYTYDIRVGSTYSSATVIFSSQEQSKRNAGSNVQAAGSVTYTLANSDVVHLGIGIARLGAGNCVVQKGTNSTSISAVCISN